MLTILAFTIIIILLCILMVVQTGANCSIFDDTASAFIVKLIAVFVFICLIISIIRY